MPPLRHRPPVTSHGATTHRQTRYHWLPVDYREALEEAENLIDPECPGMP